MQKRISKPKKKPATKPKRDANQSAFAAIQRTIELSEAESPDLAPAPEFDKATISAVMRALGSKGGKIGGKRRMETMTARERSQRALEAARARWDRPKKAN